MDPFLYDEAQKGYHNLIANINTLISVCVVDSQVDLGIYFKLFK